MIRITDPISSQELNINVGTQDWSIGYGPLALALSDRMACPWVSAELERKVCHTLIPPHLRAQTFPKGLESLQGPFLCVQAPALGWVWSERLPAILRALRGLLGPAVESAESDPYLETWKDKCEFVHRLVDVRLDEEQIHKIGKEEPAVALAEEQIQQTTRYHETVTGRLSTRSGLRWDSLSSKARPEIINLTRRQALWECDFVASEPSIVLSLLSGQNVYDADVYAMWSKLLGIPEDLERPKVKVRTMAALYGAGRSSLRSMGFDDASMDRVEGIRNMIRKAIEERFGWTTVGGKVLTEPSIAHWVQGSASDIAFRAFNAIAGQFDGTPEFGPVCPLHDGAMWLTPEEWRPESEVVRFVYQSHSGMPEFVHHGRLRWTRLR